MAGQLGQLSVCRVLDYKPDFRLAGQWEGEHLLKGNGMDISTLSATITWTNLNVLCRDHF